MSGTQKRREFITTLSALAALPLVMRTATRPVGCPECGETEFFDSTRRECDECGWEETP